MSRKDWKKTGESIDQVSWMNKRNREFITITNRFQTGDIKKKWKVYIENSKGQIIANERNNKTKSKALKIVRGYMRKH